MEKPARVEFATIDGVTLRGDFFQADGDSAGAVVMSGGLTVPKESVTFMAQSFQQAGISALVFDHRSFGSSDGTPRHHTNPDQHAEDYHDAVTAARAMPGVDPTRVALWGIGHSSGWVMMAAASEPRIKAAVIYRPIHSGSLNAQAFPAGTLERAWQERETKTSTGDAELSYIKAWPDTLENALGDGEPPLVGSEAAYRLREAVLPAAEAAGTEWANTITLQSAYHIARVEAQAFLPRITVPTLWVAPHGDPFTPSVEVQQDHFQLLTNTARREFFTSDAPTGDDLFENAPQEIAKQISFLHRVL